MKIYYDRIIKENNRRIRDYFRDYDRNIGDGSNETVERFAFNLGNNYMLLPKSMKGLPQVKALNRESISKVVKDTAGYVTEELIASLILGFINDRFTYDFEFWAFKTIKIQDKLSKKLIPFKLNKGQRILIHTLEEQRLKGVPLRVIVVKARQWGGSTVIQVYMLWLQLKHYTNWHSAIIGQYKEQSINIRSTISNIISSYPKEAGTISIKPFEGTQNIKIIPERGCKISVGSADNPEALRSFDFSMLHLSECGLWKDTAAKSADDLAQSLYATVPEIEGTLICLESTAKGIGTFFHKEYLAAAKGESINSLVFVPWYMIINYAAFKVKNQEIQYYDNLPISKVKDYKEEIKKWSDRDKYLWQCGATIEGIIWYNWYQKGKRYSDFQMKSEFPTTAEEAFQSSAAKYFDEESIVNARKFVKEPIFKGEVRGDAMRGKEALLNVRTQESNEENFHVWEHPDTSVNMANRYLVVVDIGGRSAKSDWGVISVFDRSTLTDPHFGALEKVACWRGHLDADLFAWKAAQIANMYGKALLVVESNTLETKFADSGVVNEGDHFYTVLNEISDSYSNMYTRATDPEKTKDGSTFRYGWHMNKRTKYLAYDAALKAFREQQYVERDIRAINEMEWLEIKPNGSLGAIKGEHDDIIDTIAVAIYVSENEMRMPTILTASVNKGRIKSSSGGVATI